MASARWGPTVGDGYVIAVRWRSPLEALFWSEAAEGNEAMPTLPARIPPSMTNLPGPGVRGLYPHMTSPHN